jgi:2-(1,2-epoxy-1,2-dihydrophenyl)acetyl-CoA isomerase
MEAVLQGDVWIEDRIRWQRGVQRATAGKLFRMPKPTLAVINGPAAGAGLSLALSCDLRLMAQSAFLLTAFTTVGLSGDFGVTYFLSQVLGSAKARQMMFLSDRVSAAEALELGLVNWCCEPDDLIDKANAIAARLAAGPSTAFGYMKENLNRAMNTEVDDCMDLEATHHIHCMATSDHREGVAAFIEKRAPEFGKCRSLK